MLFVDSATNQLHPKIDALAISYYSSSCTHIVPYEKKKAKWCDITNAVPVATVLQDGLKKLLKQISQIPVAWHNLFERAALPVIYTTVRQKLTDWVTKVAN